MSAHNCDFRTILKMTNRFDYEEYKKTCEESGCIPESAHFFAQTCGMLTVAETMFPGVPIELAYLQFQNIPNAPIYVSSKSQGLGDTIAKITSAIGIEPCDGCKKRQDALNRLVPYKDKN